MKHLSALVHLHTKQENTPLQQYSSQNKNLIFTFQITAYPLSKMEGAVHSNSYWNQGGCSNEESRSTLTVSLYKHVILSCSYPVWHENLFITYRKTIFAKQFQTTTYVIHHRTDATICFWFSIQRNCAKNTYCIPSVNPLVYFTCMQEQQTFCLSELNSAPC